MTIEQAIEAVARARREVARVEFKGKSSVWHSGANTALSIMRQELEKEA